MKISVYTLAQAIKVPRSRLNDIVLGRRGITADTAFRLARYFGTTPDFWIKLQARYDLDAAERKLRRRIEREVPPARRLRLFLAQFQKCCVPKGLANDP
jgi:addiction module HigA family antidote